MTAPSVSAKDILESASVGTFNSGAWPIHISKQPTDQDQAITIYDSGGLAPLPKWLLDFPSIQVVVRGNENSYSETYDKVKAVKDALLSLPSQDINGDRWVSVTMIGESAFLGYDEKSRPEFALNFRLIIEPADAAGDHRDPL